MATKKAAAPAAPAKKVAAKKATPAETPVKKPRAKAAPASEPKAAPAAKKTTRKTKVVETDEPPVKKKAAFDPYAFMNANIDEISKRQGVDTDIMDVFEPMSSGLLCYDMVLGGGIKPAMITHAGPEQGGKTTGSLFLMGAAVNANVPLVAFWDYEGSTSNSLDYVGNVLRTTGVKIPAKDIFGRKDDDGNWIVPPRVRYTPETRGEAFFDWLAAVLRDLPDKKYVKKSWWLVYNENNKKHKALVGDHADKSMNKKYGKGLWVPAPDGGLQGFVVVDSWPAMNPESNDEEEANNALGVHARFFAKHLPRIKGRLVSKMVALLGINQLRQIPMVTHGPKEKEACGDALRYNSDSRSWWVGRTSGMPLGAKLEKDENDAYVEMERSVQGKGKDRYTYSQISNKKNKLAKAKRKAWVRFWVNYKGEACGFDPVFDTLQFLKDTGQMKYNNRGSIKLMLDGKGESAKTNWMELKLWILGDKAAKTEICEKLGYKPFDLRKFCFSQIASKRAEAMYVAMGNGGEEPSTDDDDDDEDSDD